MREVTVTKEDLRSRVQHNRDEHRQVFEKALDIYRERILQHLEAKIAQVKKGEKIEHYIALPEPEDHTKDYERVLSMIDMSVDEQITLTSLEFAQYVMNDWPWRESFAANTGSYLAN